MTVNRNLIAVENALEAFNDHNFEGFTELYSDSAIHFQPNRTKPLVGKEEILDDYLTSTFKAFPDVQFEKKYFIWSK